MNTNLLPTRNQIIHSALLALVTMLFAGLWDTAQAQGAMACRDVDNLTICGSTITNFNGGGSFTINGPSVWLGPKGGRPVLIATEYESGAPGNWIEPEFRYDPVDGVEEWGAVSVLWGSLDFVNDPAIDGDHPLMSSRDYPEGVGAPEAFQVNTVAQLIYNPAVHSPTYDGLNPVRNGGFRFGFLQRFGALGFFRTDPPPNFKEAEVSFDLVTQEFNATVPIDLKLFDNPETPQLTVTARIKIKVDGAAPAAACALSFAEITASAIQVADCRQAAAPLLFDGSLDGFKLQLAGLKFDAQNVKLHPGTATSGGWFEAAQVDVSKADNPSLPNLDPANPDLVFRLEKLRYQEGQWRIGGGSVPLPDWQLGAALSLTKQSIGLGFDQHQRTYTLNISTTIGYGGADAAVRPSGVQPMNLQIGARQMNGQWQPYMNTALPNLKPTLWVSRLGLQPAGLSMVLDPATNFFGLAADQVTLLWDGVMGSQANGKLTGWKLGIDRDKNLVFNINGTVVDFPEIRSKTFTGRLRGGFTVQDGVVTVALNGTLGLNLPGNAGVTTGATVTLRSGRNVRPSCQPRQANCLLSDEMKFTTFGFKVAGFSFLVENPRGYYGGFAADQARLTLPRGVKSFGAQVNGLKVDGYGNFSLSGGGIELPPLEISGYQFVGLKGNFAKTTSGGYEFKAAGIMPMPGVDPSAGKRSITAELTFRTTVAGDFQGLGVAVNFRTTSPGIPLGTTGMELLEIGGRFDLTQGTAKVTVSLRAASQYRIASLPLVTVRGNATMQVNPFALTANAQLSVLVLDVANASFGIGAGQGFNGGAGFNVSFEVDSILVHGKAALRLGNVTLANGQKQFRWTAQATLAVGLKKNQFARFIPPKDLTLAEVGFKGGTFQVKNRGEVAGLMGTVGCCFFFKTSIFYDFARDDLSSVDADNYKLIDAAQVRALAAQRMAGYSSRVMGNEEIAALGLVLASDSNAPQVIQETVPVQVENSGTTLVGIAYPSGTPSIRLQLPDGGILTEQGVDNVNNTFVREPGTNGELTQIAFLIKDAPVGQYQLLIDNAPAQYEKVSYTLNGDAVGFAGATCSPATPTPDVTITCNGQPGGDSATISWNAFDGDSPNATVQVGYVVAPADGAPVDLANVRVLRDNLPYAAGSYTWNLLEVPTGRYKLVASVLDGQNGPVDFVADLLIDVIDKRAPQTPDLYEGESTALPAGYHLSWPPNQESDLAGYEIGFGPVNNAAQFVYTRTLGAKEVLTATGLIDAELWGLADNREVWVGVRAYDESGNYSAWSSLLGVKPWPVAPKSWTPLPDSSVGITTAIAVAFDTPLKPASVQGVLELFDPTGAPVAGNSTFITDLDGIGVIGLRFVPTSPLQNGQRYTVRLRGGDQGISTVDDRMMPTHYTWHFTTDATIVTAPVSETPVSGLLVNYNTLTVVGYATGFNASVLTGDKVSYHWNFGDGQSSAGATVSHTYATPGSYLVTVTARNAINEVSEQMVVQVVAQSTDPETPGGPEAEEKTFLPLVAR